MDSESQGPAAAIKARLSNDLPADDNPLFHLSALEWIDVIPSAVAIADASGRLVYLNDAWVKLIGATDRESVLDSPLPVRTARRGWRPDGSPIEPDDLALFRALKGESVVDSGDHPGHG